MKIQSYKNISERFHLIIILSCKYTSFSLKPTFLVPRFVVLPKYIKHIFEEGELNEDSTVRNFRTTAADGKEYLVSHYNLDMIIALGYRLLMKELTE